MVCSSKIYSSSDPGTVGRREVESFPVLQMQVKWMYLSHGSHRSVPWMSLAPFINSTTVIKETEFLCVLSF